MVGNICRDVKTAPIVPLRGSSRTARRPPASWSRPSAAAGPTARFAAGLGADVRLAGKIGVDALGERLEGADGRAGGEIVPSPRSGDPDRHFHRAELHQRLPAFRQLPAEQR